MSQWEHTGVFKGNWGCPCVRTGAGLRLPQASHPCPSEQLSPALTRAPSAELRGHSPSIVVGGFSLGAVFRVAKVELQVSSSSSTFGFFSLLSGCFEEEAWRLEAMTEPPCCHQSAQP